MKLARKVFDGRNDARGGAVDGVADDRETAIAHGVEELPCGEARERFEIAGSGFRVGGGEDQVIGLQTDHFFEVHLRPVLRGIHDAGGVSSAKRVGDECVFSDGDERVSPDDEEDAARRQGFEFCVEGGEASLEVGGKRFPRFRDAEKIGEFLGGGEDFVNIASVGGVGGDAESIESAESVEPIDFLGDENEIGMERCDFLEIRINRATHFSFLLRVGRIVAIVGIADEAVLDAESVKRFRQAGREGNNASGELRYANGAAEFVNDFAHCRWRGRLGAERHGAEQKQGGGENFGSTHGIGRIVLHESPLTKVPREI